MPIPDAHLLFAVGWADARIHIEADASRRTAAMNLVDPLAGEIDERRQVLFRCEPSRLEAPHLTRRRRASGDGLAADDPSHRRIMAEPLGVVDVLVSGQPPEHGLPQHPDERVPAVLARAVVCEPRTCRRAEAERVVQFAVGEQTGVRRDDRAAKLERQPAVEIEPHGLAVRFTRRVRHESSFQISLRC
jgi:hypothetical protein